MNYSAAQSQSCNVAEAKRKVIHVLHSQASVCAGFDVDGNDNMLQLWNVSV